MRASPKECTVPYRFPEISMEIVANTYDILVEIRLVRQSVHMLFLLLNVAGDVIHLSRISKRERERNRGTGTHEIKIIETGLDDFDGLHQLLLRDNQRRRESNTIGLSVNTQPTINCSDSHIDMRRLRQHPSTHQQQTELPCTPSLRTLRLVNHHSIQQSPSTHACDERGVEVADGSAEELA